MTMLGLVVCLAACGASGAESGSESTTTTGSEDTTTQDDVRHTPGSSEHECGLRQQRECAQLACHWVRDPDATASSETQAALPSDTQLCVQAADGGATAACPQICCEVCPRE